MSTAPATPVVEDSGTSRLAEILVEFARHRTLTAVQITNVTGIPDSAVYRHLTVLVHCGLVSPTRRRGQYSAGPESLRLAANFRQEAMVKGRITEHLQALSDETQELAAYLVISGKEALCVEAIEGPQILRCSYAPGRSQPLHRGASALALLALALLAHATAEEREEIIDGLRLDERATAELEQEIQLVQGRGFALSYGAVDAGVWGVSFPVLGEAGRLLGVVSSMAPAERAARREKQLIASTRHAALALGRDWKGLL